MTYYGSATAADVKNYLLLSYGHNLWFFESAMPKHLAEKVQAFYCLAPGTALDIVVEALKLITEELTNNA